MRCRCSKSTTDTCVGRTDSNNNATEGADTTSVAVIIRCQGISKGITVTKI